jgi:hypothetical protein
MHIRRCTDLCFGFGHTSDVVSSFSLIILMLRDRSWFALCLYPVQPCKQIFV